ncbi:MAG: ATPase [Methanoregulaceae archaeon]|nr:ATPase [Methanoregulaceae archaeon]
MAEKIVVSAVKSGAKPEDARMIAKEIENKSPDGIQTKDIRTKVLAMLRQQNPALEKNWLVYDQAVKKRA